MDWRSRMFSIGHAAGRDPCDPSSGGGPEFHLGVLVPPVTARRQTPGTNERVRLHTEQTESWTHTVSLMDRFLRDPAPEHR
jgi:hypothetical protein